MTNHKKFLYLLLIFFVLSSGIITSKAHAEYLFNFDWTDVRDQSKEASSLLFRTISNLFSSFEALERGEIYQAERLLRETNTSFRHVINLYTEIQSSVQNRDIRVPRTPIIEGQFQYYSLPYPSDKRTLVNLSKREIERFFEYTSTISLSSDSAENREIFRRVVQNLGRLLHVGISVSEIADFNR